MYQLIGGWPSAPDGPYAWGYCFLTNKVTRATTVHQVVNGLVLVEGNILDEAQSKFHSKLP